MDWIKRNLLFVAGSAVALLLMGLAGYYLYAGMGKNNAALEKLNAEYAELVRLNKQNPHPGNDKIDNTRAARDQSGRVREFIQGTAKVFAPIAPIPDSTNVSNAMLAEGMRRTVDQMDKGASSGGVQVPPKYHYSFATVKDRIMFDQAGIAPLAVQLGEVKAICDVLFAARINALDGIRREKVSVHDTEAQQSADYLSKTTVTNEIAIITPYEVSIRCFSSELAAMLAGFASSPHGFFVKTINVEPAGAAGASGAGGIGGLGSLDESGVPMAVPTPVIVQPGPGSPSALMEERYGFRPPGRPGSEMAARYGIAAPPARVPRVVAPVPAPGAARTALPVVLDEKQLKVTMLIEVVKPTPKK
jgi:hypothetical protein